MHNFRIRWTVLLKIACAWVCKWFFVRVMARVATKRQESWDWCIKCTRLKNIRLWRFWLVAAKFLVRVCLGFQLGFQIRMMVIRVKDS